MPFNNAYRYCTYIITNRKRGTLYIGVTGYLRLRIEQHKNGKGGKFSSRHRLKRLVYFEAYQRPMQAIRREKQLKNWHRQWKINLIESVNPDWNDLYEELI